MFILTGRIARIAIKDQAEIETIVGGLVEQGYSPVLRSMASAACESVGLSRDSLPVQALLTEQRFRRRPYIDHTHTGELFSIDDRLVLLLPQGNHLALWEVRPHIVPAALDATMASVQNIITTRFDGRRVRGMSFDWREASLATRRRLIQGQRAHEERMNTRAPDFTPAQLDQSRLLAQKKNREFVRSLAQLGKARSVDAKVISDPGIIQPLLDLALIRKEYLVTCRQDQKTLCSVPDKQALSDGAAKNMRCTTCGRHFEDELIQEIFAVTAETKPLLDGSHWMTVWVTALLNEAGISNEKIRWNAAAGEDEIDVIVDVQGMNVFLELKDREFGLGDAYPFGFRVERYGGSIGVVVTTERVAAEAKKFIEEQAQQRRGSQIECLEGNDAIIGGVPQLIEGVSKTAVESFFLELSEELGLGLLPLIRGWLNARH